MSTLPWIIVAILAIFSTTTTAQSNLTHTKRWYSIGTHFEQDKHGPWPEMPSTLGYKSRQPIRYCYREHSDKLALQYIVEQAIAKWQPAMEGTALGIELDKKAGDSGLCGNIPVAERDALVIYVSDSKACTIGYRSPRSDRAWEDEEADSEDEFDASEDEGEEGQAKDRHRLRFSLAGPADPDGGNARLVAMMGHELGHAIGLLHEHQRWDRSKYVTFHCSRVLGYSRAADVVKKLTAEPFAPGMHETDKMSKICSSFHLAKRYFPEVIGFVKGGDPSYTREMHTGREFDYESMMIYDSAFDPEKRSEYKSWVLYRVHKDADGNYLPVWMGGHQDFKDKVPSEGDAKRILALYPPQSEDSTAGGSGTLGSADDASDEGEGPPRKKAKANGHG